MHTRVLGVLLSAAVLAGLGPFAHAAAGGPDASPQPLKLDVTGWSHQEVSAPTPTASDGIGPGSYLLITTTEEDPLFGGPTQFICTANFVWDGSGGPFLGAAGHCFLPADTDTYDFADPYVTLVEVCVSGCAFGGQLGAGFAGEFEDLGAVVYARQAVGDEQIGNDFGLVEIPAALENLIRPNIPVWGGPTYPEGSSLDTVDEAVCMYGNGVGVGETFATKARMGYGLDEDERSWFAALPGNSGDSGSAVETCTVSATGVDNLEALGILTHGPMVGTGVAWGTTVGRAIDMAREVGLNITLRLPSPS